MLTTLKRRTKVHAAALAAADTTDVTVYTLNNHFIGEVVPVGTDYLTKQLDQFKRASLTRNGDKVTLHMHSNCWYEWTAPRPLNELAQEVNESCRYPHNT